MFTEVKHQIECGFELIHLSDFGAADLNQVHHVFMLQQLKDPNFSQCCDRELCKTIMYSTSNTCMVLDNSLPPLSRFP